MLAIAALLGGWWLGWVWLDPLIAVVGALLIGSWALKLGRDSALVLLDAEMATPLSHKLQTLLGQLLPADAALIDLHLWRLGRNQYAAIISINSPQAIDVAQLRQQLTQLPPLRHITIEVNGGE